VSEMSSATVPAAPFHTAAWEDANNRYLAASLVWLRARFTLLAERDQSDVTPPDPPAEPVTPDSHGDIVTESVADSTTESWPRQWGRRPALPGSPATERAATEDPAEPAQSTARRQVETAARAREAAAHISADPPALLYLATQLELTEFERDTLLLCVAPAVDPSIGILIANAQGDPTAGAPSFGLALRLLDSARWDVLSPHRGLRFWRLVEPVGATVQPLTSAGLRPDERIVNLVKGLNELDERLNVIAERRRDPAPRAELPPSLAQAADQVLDAARASTPDGQTPLIELAGHDAEGGELIVGRALARDGRTLHRTTAAAIVSAGPDIVILARLWERECRLLSVALLIDTTEADLDDPSTAAALRGFLSAVDGVVVLAVREVWPVGDEPVTVVDADRPTPIEQRDLWAAATGLPVDGAPAALAGQFRLSVPTLQRVAEAARSSGALDQNTLWGACLAATRPRLQGLARRTAPSAFWDDLVLPGEQLDLLRQLVAHVRHRNTVMSGWGFEKRLARGGGITALFAGPSGTGKTFAAEVLAGELHLDLYRVDLSAVVNKYIGETEKNLRRVFDAAEDGGGLILFDEADALFGRRSEVRDSHDRYANIEVNYLLQRMDSYHGVAVLATNLRAALDPAFLRRLRFVVEFDVPGPDERRTLWSKAFPGGVPIGELDLDALADLPANGAAIQQIALGAAFLAAGNGSGVDTSMVLRAARTEFRKLDLPLPALPGAVTGALR